MRIFALVLLMGCLAACSPAAPLPTPTPPLTGAVTIEIPANGSILYSSTVSLSGTALNLPTEGFLLRLVSAEEKVLGETVVQPQNGSWSTEISNEPGGDPVEVTISALPVNDTSGADYDVVSVVFASEDQRPDGVFGTILTPFAGDELGGDVVLVNGTASGLFENTMILTLEQPDGTVIQEMVLTVNNPNFIDEVPWTAEIATNGYMGAAVLRAWYSSAADGTKITLAEVPITLSNAAG